MSAVRISKARSRRSGVLAIVACALAPVAAAAQQPDPKMNFFLAPTGPTFGANQSALAVADQHCTALAYPLGFGHLTWRAYLTEGSTQARSRIGSGPWYNYYGEVIAENLAQLHSDANNLKTESVATHTGDYGPPGFVIPPGSQLDGSDFTRSGPFFCFGVA